MFIAWSTVSWWFGMAPLLAMLNGTGVVASLRDAGRLRGLRGELVEINLVMGIVKIALIVLAMVLLGDAFAVPDRNHPGVPGVVVGGRGGALPDRVRFLPMWRGWWLTCRFGAAERQHRSQ